MKNWYNKFKKEAQEAAAATTPDDAAQKELIGQIIVKINELLPLFENEVAQAIHRQTQSIIDQTVNENINIFNEVGKLNIQQTRLLLYSVASVASGVVIKTNNPENITQDIIRLQLNRPINVAVIEWTRFHPIPRGTKEDIEKYKVTIQKINNEILPGFAKNVARIVYRQTTNIIPPIVDKYVGEVQRVTEVENFSEQATKLLLNNVASIAITASMSSNGMKNTYPDNVKQDIISKNLHVKIDDAVSEWLKHDTPSEKQVEEYKSKNVA